jgi:hypothetical protein
MSPQFRHDTLPNQSATAGATHAHRHADGDLPRRLLGVRVASAAATGGVCVAVATATLLTGTPASSSAAPAARMTREINAYEAKGYTPDMCTRQGQWMRDTHTGRLAVVASTATSGSSLPLTQRVISFAGMTPSKTVMRSVASAAKYGIASKAQLVKWGFVGGVVSNLSTPGNSKRGGYSLVVELSTNANANAYLKLQHTNTPEVVWIPFAVSGIPGAVGFEQTGSGPAGGGSNVGFVSGPYAYVVGAGWGNGAQNVISNQTLIAAARKLYSRVH